MNVLKSPEARDSANLILQLGVAIIVMLFAGMCLWISATWNLTERQHSILQLFVGASIAWVGQLIAFCFPSSIGSQKKDETISKLADKAPPVTVPPSEITPKELINDGRDQRPQDPASPIRGANAGYPIGEPDQGGRGGAGDDVPIAADADDDSDDFPAEPPSRRDPSLSVG